MIKKLISVNLVLTLIIMEMFSLKTNAIAPTNYRNPECINLTGLGVEQDQITYGLEGPICGCKTCTVNAMLYDRIENYVQDTKDQLWYINEIAEANNQDKVNMEVRKLSAFNLVYIAPAIAVLLQPLVRNTDFYKYSKIAFFIVEGAGTIIGFIYKVKETKYKTVFFENKAKLNNVKSILRQISKSIENKRFKNRNFLLVSTNYNPVGACAVAQFAQKDGIEYNSSKYNEDYFNKLNEEEIKPALEEIENQVYSTYDNVEYNAEVRDVLKSSASITLPTAVLVDAYLFLTGQGIDIAQFAERHKLLITALGTGFWGALYSYFSGKGTGKDTGKELNDIVEKGVKTIKIIYDDDKDPSRNKFIKLRQHDENTGLSQEI